MPPYFLESFKILLANTHSHFPIIRDIIGKNTKGDKNMARRKKNGSCLGMLITLPFSAFFGLIDYANHYKPTPLVGKQRGRKKKKWF